HRVNVSPGFDVSLSGAVRCGAACGGVDESLRWVVNPPRDPSLRSGCRGHAPESGISRQGCLTLLAAGGPAAVPSARPSASDLAGNLRRGSGRGAAPPAAGSEGERTADGAHAARGESPN